MLIAKDPIKSPGNSSKRQPEINENAQKHENLFSPRFRSVAAMAGWDEEALLIASLIVEDTPDRQLKHKKRSDSHGFKTPPSNSRRKRRAQRRSPASIPIAVLDLDDDESKSNQESEKIEKKENTAEVVVVEEKKRESGEEKSKGSSDDVSISSPAIPCLDRLREELSCAICLEICYEPSTTPCGHSFCKKCLRSAADRCGKKCPKCRQIISNGKYCTVNTVLWNTIQLIFPKEVEARKANEASASDTREQQPQVKNPSTSRNLNTRNRVVQALISPESESRTRNHRFRNRSSRPSGASARPSQDEDAALALRLQREEFMETFESRDSAPVARANLRAMASRDSVAVARANLRAMASRAHNIRVRGRRE